MEQVSIFHSLSLSGSKNVHLIYAGWKYPDTQWSSILATPTFPGFTCTEIGKILINLTDCSYTKIDRNTIEDELMSLAKTIGAHCLITEGFNFDEESKDKNVELCFRCKRLKN